MGKQHNSWFADGVLFDELDIKRWQVYAFYLGGFIQGVFTAALFAWGRA